ncbi:hypothetical protein PTSG_08670 [Salpingoeca rosetta]|uniref:Transmembrane protein n=1 Tax=Salpingoeca rosetta (strain ATCC 50818 / BSB-021) TaxID=946362 RepID=F2UKC4_SALR5|nr:uncharacterized protein PTSG_08670 [Salpingoeca rosetta]EGD77573.1 hypothetical protein PTSG_08670 [Salpingoeca rosetta]|eukprot:XP_004990461.1 hypothetical protein PTSG_08670 [Salpingoeca rosetta]
MGAVLGVGDATRAHVTGSAVTVIVGGLLYANLLVWQSYLQVVFWAFLLSQALRPLKSAVLETIGDLRQKDVPEDDRLSLLDAFHEFVLQRMWQNAAEGYNDRHRRHAILGALVNNSFIFFGFVLLLITWHNSMGPVQVASGLFILATTVYVAARVLDRHLLNLHRLFLTDNALVTLTLTFGSVFMVGFVIFFLGIASLSEGIHAVDETYIWVTAYIHENNEYMQSSWSHLSSTAYTAYQDYVKENFNNTEWWPAVENVERAILEEQNITQAIEGSREYLDDLYGAEPWWGVVDRVVELGIRQQGSAHDQAKGFFNDMLENIDVLQHMGTHLLSQISNPAQLAFNVMFRMSSAISAVSTFGSQLLVFGIFFYEFTAADDDLLSTIIHVLVPASRHTRNLVIRNCQMVISAAFFIPLSLASLHALTTLVMTTVLGIRFRFFATFLSFVVTLVPITDPLVVPIVWAVAPIIHVTITSTGLTSLVKAVVFLLVCVYTYSYANRLVLEQQRVQEVTGNPVLTLFSVLLGCYAFGIAGFILGPLALYLLMMVVRLCARATFEMDAMEADVRETAGTTTPPSATASRSTSRSSLFARASERT